MNSRPGSFLIKYCITAALALGTAWAIRGQFGHEYGAAWAGAIGMLAILVLSDREDWNRRLPAIVAISAIAWGCSGMMSYGMVVGYGRSDNFPNVLYGLYMLFVMGGLYGFIGGGLSGLSLEGKKDFKLDWASLITQMIAGGLLFWFVIIQQLGYLMTPPRSELWAACLGASCALAWFLYRNDYRSSLRVALWSALGAGFGFSLGNFLQTLGTVSGISFNWWNVMEYSIGFFGGLGMAYGIVTEQWPEKQTSSNLKWSNLLGGFTLIIALPLINMIEGITGERLLKLSRSMNYDHTAQFISSHQLIAWAISLLMILCLVFLTIHYCFSGLKISKSSLSKRGRAVFFLYFLWFMMLSNLVGGTWLSGHFTSQHLYWVNLLAIWFLLRHINKNKEENLFSTDRIRKWKPAFAIFIMMLLSVIIMSLISVNIHHGLPGMQNRF